MIFDYIKNIKNYKGLSENLDKAIDFISSHDFYSFEPGRYEIDEDRVYMQVMEVKTREPADLAYELHRNYMDIQINLSSGEELRIGSEDADIVEEYSEERDIAMKRALCISSVILSRDRFAVCMPEEPHLPTLAIGGSKQVKKIVFKVKK